MWAAWSGPEPGGQQGTSMFRQAVIRAAFAAILVVAAAPAHAADPVFPVNSRIGLAPPPGFAPSRKFPGFETEKGNAAILLVELPAEAFAEVEKGFTDEALKARGMMVEKREPIELAGGRGFLVVGDHTVGNLKKREMLLGAVFANLTALVSVQIADEARASVPEAALRDALKTIVVRASVPDAEKLSSLPYKLTELSGFRVVRGGPDGTALLTDGPEDTVAAVAQPFVLVSMATAETPKAEDRDTFARRAFSSIPGIKEVKILRAEPLRINSQAGYEILAEAKDLKSDTEVTTVQWIRFGSGGYLQMFAIARRNTWADLFPRLRAIRDGIDLR
jgi:hypothetical protein